MVGARIPTPEQFQERVESVYPKIPRIPFPTLIGPSVPTAILVDGKVWILKKNVFFDWDNLDAEDLAEYWSEVYDMYLTGKYKFVQKFEIWHVPGGPTRCTHIFCYELSDVPEEELDKVRVMVPLVVEKDGNIGVLYQIVEGEWKDELFEEQTLETIKADGRVWSVVRNPLEEGWVFHLDE
jgi:hypothetical protein